jgi:hypothetical protein
MSWSTVPIIFLRRIPGTIVGRKWLFRIVHSHDSGIQNTSAPVMIYGWLELQVYEHFNKWLVNDTLFPLSLWFFFISFLWIFSHGTVNIWHCSATAVQQMSEDLFPNQYYLTLNKYGCTSGYDVSKMRSNSDWFGIFGTYSCLFITSAMYRIFSVSISPTFSLHFCRSKY